jgi:hypothetical protein
MKPTDLPVLILSINDGKPLVVTSETRHLVVIDHCIVIDMSSTPPRVLSVYRHCRYTYFKDYLPDQFLDHEGNLRNGQGRIVFLAHEAEDTTAMDDDPNNVSPYITSATAYWIKTVSKVRDIQRDLETIGCVGITEQELKDAVAKIGVSRV